MRHHYIPRFYLAHFATQEGKRRNVWVLDKTRRQQWITTPSKAAHRRNYYRATGGSLASPDDIEHAFASVENEAAPALRRLLETKRIPDAEHDYSALLNFVALMAVRVPGARGATTNLMETLAKQVFRNNVSSPEIYYSSLERMRKDGYSADEDISYEHMRDFIERDDYRVVPPQDLTLAMMLMGFDFVLGLLAKRTWFVIVARQSAHDFVCSDRPVTVNWLNEPPRGFLGQPGFGMLDTMVTFPLSCRVALS